ncbi:DNA cytosine methyltransferase [Amycolatopsis heterodermiae]|uniref:DNA cytosine methyltransferase n=1 Tax=Amycolatopsis heterodermiae TaxID=3110235 RepID=UPI00396A5779
MPALGPVSSIKQGSRSGLWLTIAQGVRVLRPGIVVLENVAALRRRGLSRVLGDLATLGYDARWTSLRASDAGAPHRRERVFILAYLPDHPAWAAVTDANRQRPLRRLREPGVRPPTRSERRGRSSHSELATTYPQAAPDWGQYEPAIRRWEAVTGRVAPAPTERGTRGQDRLAPAFVEWLMGLPAGFVTGLDLPYCAQLKALGNGVVPQQATDALRRLLTGLTPPDHWEVTT